MPLHLVTGRANTGKTELIIETLLTAARSGRPSILLVPNASRVASLREMLSVRGAIGVQVTTLEAWVESLWGLLGDGRRLVGPIVRESAVAQALADSGALADLASKRGAVRLVARLANSVAQGDCDAPRLPDALSRALREYAAILADEGFVEPGQAARALAAGPSLAGACLCCLGFRELSPAHLDLVGSLERDNDVWVAIAWEEGFAATRAAESLVLRLAARADHTALDKPAPSTELDGLEAGLFGEVGAEPLRFSGDVQFAVASGDEAETSLLATLVGELVEEGFAENEIAIAIPQLCGQEERLVRELAAEGVDAEVEGQRPFYVHPFGRAALALLTLALGGGGRDEMLAFLLSPYGGASNDEVQQLDVAWRRARTIEPASLLSRVAGLGGGTATAVSAARRAVARGFDDESRANWKKLADGLLNNASEGRELHDRAVAQDAAAHRTLLHAVDDASASSRSVPAGAFVAALRSDDLTVGNGPRSAGVRIVSLRDLPGRRFDVVVLSGANADEWASGARSGALSELLRRAGAPATDELLRERYRSYMAISRARRRLVLCRKVADSAGVGKRPAALWDDVLDLYREPGSDAEGDHPAGAPVRRLQLTDIGRAAPAINDGQRRRRETPFALGPVRRGQLLDDAALAVLAAREQFSVTELEAYLGCPYRWFYERVVRPREIDRELGAREVGAYAHEILETFYAKLRAAGHPRVTPELLPVAEELLDEVVAEVGSRRHVQPQNLAERLALARAHEQTRALVRDDAGFLPGWRPVAGELSFGTAEAPAFAFAGVSLVGRIDRIDGGDGCATVTDYKSGGGQPGQGSFVAQGRLQPVVYAVAAASALGSKPAGGFYRSLRTLEVRGFWRTELMSPPPHSKGVDGVDEERWAELVDETAAAVAEAVRGIRAGEIPPRARQKASCSYCAAASACGRMP